MNFTNNILVATAVEKGCRGETDLWLSVQPYLFFLSLCRVKSVPDPLDG